MKRQRSALKPLTIILAGAAVLLALACGGDSDATTRIAELMDVPVLSEQLLPEWSEEEKAGLNLTAVCPSPVSRTIFAEESSKLLRGPNGERARSGTVLFSEHGEAPDYAQEVFADAPSCAQQLLQSWLSEAVALESVAEQSVGDEAVTLAGSSDAVSTSAILFRRDSFVVAVVLVGGDRDGLLLELAGALDTAIVGREGGWELSPVADEE